MSFNHLFSPLAMQTDAHNRVKVSIKLNESDLSNGAVHNLLTYDEL